MKWRIRKAKGRLLELKAKRNRKKNKMSAEDISVANGKRSYDLDQWKGHELTDNGKANSLSNPQGNKRTKNGESLYFDQKGFNKAIDRKTESSSWDNYKYVGNKLVYDPKKKKK